ncbi:DUF2868 domain-containing protein [Piscinibacter sakaiensis]|uniref:DUF2868 domain-containing protein n=1 Tax=Piscinibacter sakaiensis TaxID=1547922 RepID=UPI003AABAB6B
MNIDAAQARQLLLVRAFETDAAAAPTAPNAEVRGLHWTADDADWASTEALRQVGEQAPAEQWLTSRAALASERLVQREPKLAQLLRAGAAGTAWTIAALVGLALLAGLASYAVGPDRRINLLAPPLLAVMAWNLAVYLVLLLQLLRRRDSGDEPGGGWLRRVLRTLAGRFAKPSGSSLVSPPVQAFATSWARASQPLQMARLATVLHLAALAVAAGALLALYARGLAFEYRAGWDSTFLDVDTVHRWLRTLLAPALAITGSALPDPQQLQALRFAGGGGEPAARWIHWYAITTALVMSPRLLLAVVAIWRTRRLRRRFPLALDERYFQRLLQWLAHSRDQTSHLAVVQPYAFRAATSLQAPLAAAIDAEFGPGLQVAVLPEIPLGNEDSLASDWPRTTSGEGRIDLLLPLFALSATPELETHGQFLKLLLARAGAVGGQPRFRALIDESGFRQRLAGPELHNRLQQRRAAWQKLLDAAGAGDALFIDLSNPESSAATDR